MRHLSWHSFRYWEGDYLGIRKYMGVWVCNSFLGSSQPGCFKRAYLRSFALFCALLRSFALFCALSRSFCGISGIFRLCRPLNNDSQTCQMAFHMPPIHTPTECPPSHGQSLQGFERYDTVAASSSPQIALEPTISLSCTTYERSYRWGRNHYILNSGELLKCM